MKSHFDEAARRERIPAFPLKRDGQTMETAIVSRRLLKSCANLINECLKRLPSDSPCFQKASVAHKAFLRESKDLLSKNRSLRQNKYYWGIVLPQYMRFREVNGDIMSVEKAHSALQLDVGHFSYITTTNRTVYVEPTGTSHLTAAEFETYLERVRNFAIQEGFYVPLPNEQHFEPHHVKRDIK